MSSKRICEVNLLEVAFQRLQTQPHRTLSRPVGGNSLLHPFWWLFERKLARSRHETKKKHSVTRNLPDTVYWIIHHKIVFHSFMKPGNIHSPVVHLGRYDSRFRQTSRAFWHFFRVFSNLSSFLVLFVFLRRRFFLLFSLFICFFQSSFVFVRWQTAQFPSSTGMPFWAWQPERLPITTILIHPSHNLV